MGKNNPRLENAVKLGRITAEERRDRIDTAHVCLRRRLSRAKTAALFQQKFGITSIVAINGWLALARKECAESLSEHIADQAAISIATLSEVIAIAFEAKELRTVVAAQAELNRMLIPSADAREHTRAASASADKLVDKLAELTADDDEIRTRMEAVEDAQDEVVAARQPFIVTPPDRVTA